MAVAAANSESPLIAQRVTGDRIMTAVAWFLCVLSLLVAPVYGEWKAAIGCGAVLAFSLQVCALWKPGRRVTRVLSAIVFMCFGALLIHEMHGMIEMHFTIFVLLAFLLFYSDWLPLVVGAGVIAVHHLGFHLLQMAGAGVWVFPAACGIGMVLIHAAFVVFETLLLIFMALQHERAAHESGEVIAMLGAVLADSAIDLRVRSQAALGSASQFSRLIGALGELVSQISHHSEGIVKSGDRITSLSASVSSASELQKRQVGHIVAAMEQMKSSVSEISVSSQHAAANMMRSKEDAVQGGRVVEEAIQAIQALAASTRETASAIEELGRSSESIGRIVVTIREITEQTNLLALNASIEAARAGEQGRGFAVVAGQVRNLAERAASATQEISGIVATLQKETSSAVLSIRSGAFRVDAGVDAAGRAREALQHIIAAAETQNRIISQIAGASTEQASATEQVNANMREILKMAEQSVLSAEQSAEECKSISHLACDLQQVVRKFQVDDEHAGPDTPLSRSEAGSSAALGRLFATVS